MNRWLRLMRLHQPVGVYLLLWPVLLGLVDAALLTTGKLPAPWLWLVAALGALVTRSAGCIANDLCDRDIDGRVKRTRNRPLATGTIASRQALLLMLALFAIAALLAWLWGPAVVLIALLTIPLILLYPLAKRFTGHPQAVLAITFSMGIPMSYAVFGQLATFAWLPLMLANMAWIYAYDTVYAMADKDDDAYLGIHSSALSWGRHDWRAVAVFQTLTLVLLGWWWLTHLQSDLVIIAIGCTAIGFGWQQWHIRQRSIARCVRAFQSNHWLQALILLGLVGDSTLPW